MRLSLTQALILVLSALLAACRPEAVVPAQSVATDEEARIYPDYRNVTIPPNIAPLNLRVRDSLATAFVAEVSGRGGSVTAAARADEALRFDSLEWRRLLLASKGSDLSVTLYARHGDAWFRHPDYTMHVAEEEVDPYLAYRLIEPSYELYRQLGLYQRNLENFDERVIYENNRTYSDDDNHCVNCHNFQSHSAGRMLFHVRARHGGTVFIHDGKAEKVDLRNDSILSGAVYPAWHPVKPWVVFSSNQTGQAFHLTDPQKIEVIDYGSDLIFYDVEKNVVRNVLRTDDTFETFPAFAPDGRRLFYCSAPAPYGAGLTNAEARIDSTLAAWDNVRYDILSMPFDPETLTFGPPSVEVDCRSVNKSASLPRVSPDGRWLLFTLGDFGQFHIWHRSSDLWLKDLRSGELRPLSEVNSPDVDSYHAWSSNGRWIVVATRRDDGSYTRLYLAYFDRDGRARKPFLLPQADPEHNLLRMKSYNVPEFSRDAVNVDPETLRKVIYDDGAARAVTLGPAVSTTPAAGSARPVSVKKDAK
ncbi:MAG: PD40 domain-containing protein [Prevotellaceae bacterium]|nr:PD40 domain-containing protein [Prevotellaceae bacterium]